MSVQYERSARRRRNAARCRALAVVAGVVLFAGTFLQITMLARISAQSKLASGLEVEVEELDANADNLELSINRYHNLDSIAIRARELGLEQPTEGQIRVVSVARSDAAGAGAQAAENLGAPGIQN